MNSADQEENEEQTNESQELTEEEVEAFIHYEIE